MDEPLTIEIVSFSYKTSDTSEIFTWDKGRQGGGFVFDLRCLPNPGRLEVFKDKTGLDIGVREFLEKEPSVATYKTHVEALIGMAIENYLSRKFVFLSVSFGCTGGQHRSVYFTEWLYSRIGNTFGSKVSLVVRHRNLQEKGMI